MARACLASSSRTLVLRATLAALTVAWLCAPQDAEAQRRRRRRNTTQTTSTTATTATTATGGDGDGDQVPPANGTATATSATTATTSATAASTATTSAAAATAATNSSAQPEPEPPPAREEPTTQPSTQPSTQPTPAAEGPRPAALDARLGFAVVGRSFWYTDDLFMQLRPYSLAIAPAINAAVEFYPGAIASRGVASMFGLVADGQFTMLFASTDSQGRSYPTLAYNFNAGARARMWLLNRIDIGVLLGFSMQNFSINRGAVMLAPAQGIANTTYMGLRAGLTGRAQIIDRLAITAGSTWQYVLTGGEVTSAEYFQRATVMAVDFSLGAAVALAKGLEVRLSADWRRYFFSMNPQPGDPLIAGGAVDDNYGITASIAFRR